MTAKKILLICWCILSISACAVKDHSPDSFKNYTARQLLRMGEVAVTKKNYNEATKYFEAIDALYPFDQEAEQGKLSVIYAYYKAEDYASALAAANRYIRLYPEGKHTDYVYYMKGVVNFVKDQTLLHKIYPRTPENLDVTNLRDSFIIFSEMLNRFPKSVYARDAAKKMVYARDLLAEHELNIARYYFERKAYIAAANKASYVVKHFTGAPQVKSALEIMVKSYRALGLAKQESDALRVLQLNF